MKDEVELEAAELQASSLSTDVSSDVHHVQQIDDADSEASTAHHRLWRSSSLKSEATPDASSSVTTEEAKELKPWFQVGCLTVCCLATCYYQIFVLPLSYLEMVSTTYLVASVILTMSYLVNSQFTNWISMVFQTRFFI